tara:strand:- start:5167 stop:5319 length:153 start_codon:yes stop_codon:yes gene_type:complete
VNPPLCQASRTVDTTIRTLQRWKVSGAIVEDKRPTAKHPKSSNKLSDEEQ